jgi:hypothetical protein
MIVTDQMKTELTAEEQIAQERDAEIRRTVEIQNQEAEKAAIAKGWKNLSSMNLYEAREFIRKQCGFTPL